MKLIECKQGSEEWIQARCGVITASKFKDAVDVEQKGLPTAASKTYAAQVALERISGKPCDDTFVTWQMKRGTEREPEARMAYEIQTGNLASESGVVLTDDSLFGYSTDGFIDSDGGIEIKSLSSATKIIELWAEKDISAYVHQIQGGLWITGRKWIDFVMYCPELESIGKQLLIRRIYRDEEFIAKLEKDLWSFNAIVARHEAALRSA